MNKFGFTLVEILVVITLIILLSASTWYSFFHFISAQETESRVRSFVSKIENFESEVQSKNILNYSATLMVGTGYVYEINKKSISYDFINPNTALKTFTLTGNTLASSRVRIQRMSGGKFMEDIFFPGGTQYTGTFDVGKEQEYTFYVDEQQKNKLGIAYYNILDTKNDKKNLVLVGLGSEKSETGKSFTGVVIKNLSGKRVIEAPDGTILSTIHLFFELGGKNYSLTFP